LLPNNTASETNLHKSGAVRSVDWKFITGAPVGRRLGVYVTLDKTFQNIILNRKYGSPSYCQIFFLIAFLEGGLYYRGGNKSLARPGRKQSNVSVRMAYISFGALPCWKKKKLDDISRLDVVEIARIPDMLPSLFPFWSG